MMAEVIERASRPDDIVDIDAAAARPRHSRPRLGSEPAAGAMAPADTGEQMQPGTRVEVRSRFDDRWASGFEVLEDTGEGYRVRRLSDGAVLPAVFPADDVRRERQRKRGMWWY